MALRDRLVHVRKGEKGRAPLAPLPTPAAPVPPPVDRGRMLYVDDIMRLLGTRPDGRPQRSAWWVRTQFAQDRRHKLGRTPFWWEHDVAAELHGMTTSDTNGEG